MCRFNPLILTLVLFPFVITPVDLSGQNQDTQINAIKEIIQAYADARDASNPAEIEALFTPDADQLVSSGVWRKGLQALVEGMLQSSKNNPGDRSLEVETVRFISDGVAVADARYYIKSPDGSERNMWSTFLLVYEQTTWKITAIRNMLPAR